MTKIKAFFDPNIGFFQSLVTGSAEPIYYFEITGSVAFKDTVTFLSGATGISGSGGSVDAVFGRTGDVVAAANDYNATQISHSAITNVTGSTVALAIEGLRNFVVSQTGSSYTAPVFRSLSGFVSSATAEDRRCFTAANTVARGSSGFSVSVLFDIKYANAPEAQTLASCWDGTNGWYIEVEGRNIRFVLTTAGGTRTVEKQVEAPFYSKIVLITGTYSGDGTFAFQNLFVNNYSYVNTYTGGTDGTFISATGSDVFTVGARRAGATNSAIRCRIGGIAYYSSNLGEEDIANVFEASRDANYLTNTASPTNLWNIPAAFPTTTWIATVGGQNLTAVNSVALAQESLSVYWF